jgi:hypothetical protein
MKMRLAKILVIAITLKIIAVKKLLLAEWLLAA